MSAFLPPSGPDLASAAAGRRDPRPAVRHVPVPVPARSGRVTAERSSGRWWFAFDQWLPMPASEADEFVLA